MKIKPTTDKVYPVTMDYERIAKEMKFTPTIEKREDNKMKDYIVVH